MARIDLGRRRSTACLALLTSCAASATPAEDPERPVVLQVQLEVTPVGTEAARQDARAVERSRFRSLEATWNRWQPSSSLACSPTVQRRDEQVILRVGEVEVPLPERVVQFADLGDINVVPYNSRSVLVAYHTPQYPTLQSQSVLFWLECSASPRLFVAAVASEAEFGRALPSSDGRWLYFPDVTGLQRLDLASLHLEKPNVELRVRNRPDYRPSCWGGAEIERPYLFPVAWVSADRHMSALNFARCGFEGDPEGQPASIVGFDTNSPTVRTSSLVATVVVDSSRALWVGDGGYFESPGMTDPSTRGFVWRSNDQGATWLPVDVGSTTAVRQLATHGTSILALTQTSTSMIEVGGDLHLTRDAGRSWKELPLAGALVSEERGANGSLFDQVEVFSWWPLRVRAWRHLDDEEQTFEATLSSARERRLGSDGSAEEFWKRVAARPRPERSDQTAVLGAVTFRATEDGLLRVTADGQNVVFRTVDHWRATDWQGTDGAAGAAQSLDSHGATEKTSWQWGCRSRAQVLASSDQLAKQWLENSLKVTGVSAGDVLHLRRAASPRARVVADLAPSTRGIDATGNLCKYASEYWVQVRHGEQVGWGNGRYLSAAPAHP